MTKKTATSTSTRGTRQHHVLVQRDACEVLQQLREHDFNSSSDLARQCGIPVARLSAAISFLAKKGLVKRPGRNGSLHINASYGHVIGVDIGGSNMRIGLADMKGTVLSKWSTSTKRTSSPDMVIEQIRAGVTNLLEQASVPRRSLLAIAAGAPGITDADSGVVVATSYLKGWRNVPF